MSFFNILNELLRIKKPVKLNELEVLRASVQKDYKQKGVDLLDKIFIALGLKKDEGQDNSLDVPHYPLSENYGRSYNHSVYQKLLPVCQLAYLSEQNGIAEEHAFKLATIFDKEEAALSYLLKRAKNIRPSKNSASANEYVVHDGCLFDLPAPDTCHFKQWQQLAHTHLENPRFRELFPHAAELERIGHPIISAKKKKSATPEQIQQEKDRLPLITQKKEELSRLIKKHKDLDTKPVTNLTPAELTKRQEDLSLLGKSIGEQRRQLTKLCQGLPFHQMDMIVLQAFYESYKHTANAGHKILIDNGIIAQEIAKFYQLNKAKKEDFIPNVSFDGQILGYPGFYLKKLDTLSDQGAALAACLGKITKCCQYLGGVGGACAIHGITSPNGGFYVVCEGNAEYPSLEDPIVAQAWVWRGQSKGLCLDSIETAPRLKESERPMIADFFRLLGHTLCQKHGISKVNTGSQSGITQDIALENCYTQKEHFLDYHGYCDSKSQLPLANQTMPYLFYGQTHSEFLQKLIIKETPLFFTTLFTPQEALKNNQTLTQALAFALDPQREDLLHLLREASIDAKRQEEFEVLMQVNKQYRDNLNQDKIDLKLIEQGADINMLNDKGESALHIAALAVELDLFEQLMALNPKLNLQDRNGNTVLLRVLEKIVYEKKNEKGRPIIGRLIEAGAELDIKDKDEVTPLMLAVQNNDLPLVKTLIEKGSDIDTFDAYMRTALFLAAEKGLTDVFDYLLKKGAKLDSTNYFTGETVLIAAIQDKNLAIIKAILASPECDFKMFQQKNKLGTDALARAISIGQEDLFQELLASPYCTAEALQKSGCFMDAATYGNTWAVQTILKNSCANTKLLLQLDKQNDNALALAIKHDHSETALAILASTHCTKDVLQQLDQQNNNALALAIKHDRSEIALTILARPDYTEEMLQQLDGQNDNVLALAIKFGHLKIVSAILASPNCTKEILMQLNKLNENAVILAIKKGYSEVALTILANLHGSDELLQQYGGITHIFITAAGCGDIKVVQKILDSHYGNTQLLLQLDETNNNALAWAIKNDHYKIVSAILDSCWCTDEVLEQADLANLLIAAAEAGDVRTVQKILGQYNDTKLLLQLDSKADNALTLAVRHEIPEMVFAILNSSSCTDKVLLQSNYQGNNALLLAIKGNYPKIAMAILASPWCTPKVLQQIDLRYNNALTLAINMDYECPAEVVLAILSSPHCTDKVLQQAGGIASLFMRAVGEGNTEGVQGILGSPFGNTELLLGLNKYGKNNPALTLAIANNHPEMALAILASPCCTENVLLQLNKQNNNVLLSAIQEGYSEVALAVLASPHCTADVLLQQDGQNNNALALAIKKGHSEIVSAILASPHCTLELLIELQNDKKIFMNVTAKNLIPQLIEKLTNQKKIIVSEQSIQNVLNPNAFFSNKEITEDKCDSSKEQQHRTAPGHSGGD